MMKKYSQTNGGYTLLFAVLVASLVLAIGISILNINKKEFLLTASARDSSAAFYAADGGLECAIAADLNGAFDPIYEYDKYLEKLNSSCNVGSPNSNTLLDWYKALYDGDTQVYVFESRFGQEGTSCAHVTITKTPATETVDAKTTIDSKGYNTGWDTVTMRCNKQSVKRVERAIRYTF